jgi:hypothetical protein
MVFGVVRKSEMLQMDTAMMMQQIDASLCSLDHLESRNNQDIRMREWLIQYQRSVSARFCRYAEDPQNPEMLHIDRIVAKRFADMANREEEFIQSLVRSNARLAERKSHYIALLEQLQRLAKESSKPTENLIN